MKNTKTNHQTQHIPVLLEQVLSYLAPKEGETYLDLTAGYGGHAEAIMERTLQPSRATLVDRDQTAIEALKNHKVLASAEIIHQDFLGASRALHETGHQYNMILADLGVSSPHLDMASRGFSIKSDGPLDMRMDRRQSLTAEEIVNNYSTAELTRLLRDYGEEPKARIIAESIVEHRPIATTGRLATVVREARRGPAGRIDPATKTFQALRIAVNAELEQLGLSLPLWLELLAPGGRIVIISFHSLEDRLVKQFLDEQAGNRYDAPLRELTKRPVTAESSEIAFNPRARSAKLRAAVKINI